MKKRNGGFKILVIVLVLMLLVVTVGAVLLIKNKQDIDEFKTQISDLELEIEENKQLVYVAIDDLTKGTVLEDGVNIELQENVTGLPIEMYITDEDLGKTLLVDVAAYEPVMHSMVTSEVITKDTREYEVGVANLMLDQQVNDYIDIRLMFPNGEDYVVCSKLKVKKLSLENNIFYTNLNEDEILTLASATIDAYTITGTKIYVTRYVESNLQEKSIPNYPIRSDILNLLATDPNIVEVAQQTLNYEARLLIEQKLSLLSEEQLQSVSDGLGLTDTAHNTAFVAEQAEQETMVEDNLEDTVNE